MNGMTNREHQIIGSDETSKLNVNPEGSASTFDATIKDNGTAKAARSSLVAGTDGTTQRPLLTDEEGRLVTTSEVVSLFPAFREFLRKVVSPNALYSESFPIIEGIAIKEFHIGGKVACEGILAKYYPSNSTNRTYGGLNSPAEVAAWTNTGNGSSGPPLVWAYATDQFVEGTGSAKLTFTQSDNNNYPEISLSYSTPQDFSSWRYIKASARVTVATGGNQTRRVQIRLTSGTAVRIWEIAGTTTTAPFNVEQWHHIIGEMESPTSIAGTGTFDINNVTGVSLRLLDGGNKAGTIWWDDVELVGELNIIEKIYSAEGSTNQLTFDPVIVFEAGENLFMSIKNNNAIAGEVQAAASGVSI